MATIGQQFKAAREARRISAQEAGAATKILTRIVVAMEADDFSGMAAPTYAKGFIRLYAGYLGLNPEPLIEEYVLRHAPGPKPVANGQGPSHKVPPRAPGSSSLNLKRIPGVARPSAWFGVPAQFFSKAWARIAQKSTNGGTAPVLGGGGRRPVQDIRILAGAAAGLLVLIILIVSATNCARRHAAEKSAQQPLAAPAHTLLDGPLPDLYLVEPGKIESSR